MKAQKMTADFEEDFPVPERCLRQLCLQRVSGACQSSYERMKQSQWGRRMPRLQH